MSSDAPQSGAKDVRRIDYPRVRAALVESINALASSGLRYGAPGDPGSWETRPDVRCGSYERAVTMDVRIGGAPQRVHLDAAAAEAALGELVVPDFEAVDGDLQAAVFETTLAGALGALGELLNADVALAGVHAHAAGDGGGEPASGAFVFEILGSGRSVVCSVLVEVTSPLPASVIDALARAARPLDCGNVPVRIAFEVGAAELSRDEVRSLAPGDIVLLDRCDVLDDRVRVTVGDRVWRIAELRETGVTLAGSGNGSELAQASVDHAGLRH